MRPIAKPKRPARVEKRSGTRPKQRSGSAAMPAPAETEALVKGLVERIAPSQQRLFSSLRRALRRRFDTAFELVYGYRHCVVVSFSPNERGDHGIVALRADKDSVRLYFNRGAELVGSSRLLNGSGKLARWMQVSAASTLNAPEVKRMVADAIALSSVPFPKRGKGAVIVRTGGATPRSRGARER